MSQGKEEKSVLDELLGSHVTTNIEDDEDEDDFLTNSIVAKRRTGTITINPIKERERSPVNVVKVTSTSSVSQFHTSIGSSTNVSKTKKYESAVNLLRQKKQQQQLINCNYDSTKQSNESTGQSSLKSLNRKSEFNENSDASSIVTTSSCSCEDHSDYDDEDGDNGAAGKSGHTHGHDSTGKSVVKSGNLNQSSNCTPADGNNSSQINKQEYKIKKSTRNDHQKSRNSTEQQVTNQLTGDDLGKGKRSSTSGHKVNTLNDSTYKKDKGPSVDQFRGDRLTTKKYEDAPNFGYGDKSRDRGHRSRLEEDDFYNRHGHERVSFGDRKRKFYDLDDNEHSYHHRHHGHGGRGDDYSVSYYKRYTGHGHHSEHSSMSNYHYYSSNYDLHRSQDKITGHPDVNRKRQRSNYESYSRSESKDSFSHQQQRQSTSRSSGYPRVTSDRRSSHQMVHQQIDDHHQLHHQSTSSTATKINRKKQKPTEDEIKIVSNKKISHKNETKLTDDINLNTEKVSHNLPDADEDEVKDASNKEDNVNDELNENNSNDLSSNCKANCIQSDSDDLNLGKSTADAPKSKSPDAIEITTCISGDADESSDAVGHTKGASDADGENNELKEAPISCKSLLVSSIGAIKSTVTPGTTCKLINSTSKTSRLAVKSYTDLLSYFFKDAIYFIMKSNVQENIDIAMSKSLWSTPALNEAKLNHSFIYYRNVILIFSTKESGKFAGFARLSSPLKSPPNGRVNWILPPGISEETFFNGTFDLDWICKKDLQFTKTAHLFNPLNEGKPVKIARDGQQVDNAIAEQLLNLFPADESIDLIPLLKKMKRQTKNRPSVMPIVSMVPMMLHHHSQHHPHHHHHHQSHPHHHQSDGSHLTSSATGHEDPRNPHRKNARLSVHRRLGPKVHLGRLGPIVSPNFNPNFDPYTSNNHPRGGPWKRRR